MKTKNHITKWMIVGLCIFFIGCTSIQNSEINTVDKLKELKKAGIPVSEMDKCLKEIESGIQRYDEYMKPCVEQKLVEVGYTESGDNIDCIMEGIAFANYDFDDDGNLVKWYDDDVVCTTERYNEDVERSNQRYQADTDCYDEQPEDLQNRLTFLDCAALS